MRYQVALSFAGEQRVYVEEVALYLQVRLPRPVFYDDFYQADLVGKYGTEIFQQIYSEDSEWVVMFISREYVEKEWTRHEKRAALSRALTEKRDYIIPVRFDDSVVPGLPSDLLYIDAKTRTPAEVASIIGEKLGVSPFAGKASDEPAPRSDVLTGEVSFNYSSHNHRYIIGADRLEFETRWSKAGNGQIYIYEDPSSIHGVAVAQHANSIDEVIHAASLDYTSRYRRPQTGQIVVLQNVSEFYAAVQILEVRAGTGNDDQDLLRFRYAIQSDGSESFGNFAGRLPD